MIQTITGIVTSLTLQSAAFLRDLSRSSAATAAAASKMQSSVKNIESSFVSAGRSVQKFAGLFTSLFAVQQIASFTRAIADYSDAWQIAGNQIAAAEQISGRHARSLEEVNKIALASRSSIADISELYAKLLRTTAGVANSEEEVARVTETVAKAFKAGGASTLEQVNAIRQLGQALGSGILQGDELRSVRENAPLIAEAIAKEFNTTIAGLKKLGAEGALSSDRVFKAILHGGDDISTAFARTNSTVGEAFTQLNNALTQYIGTISKSTGATLGFTRALSGFAVHFTEIADLVTHFLSAPILRPLSFIFNQIQESYTALKEALDPTPIIEVGDASADSTEQLLAYAGALNKVAFAGKGQTGVSSTSSLFDMSGLVDFTVAKNFDAFAPLRQLDEEVKAYLKHIADAHKELIAEIGTPLEQYKLKLEEIASKVYSAADAERANAAAEREYKNALDETLHSLGLILPQMAEYAATKRAIAAAGLDSISTAQAEAVANLKLKDGQDDYLSSLGVTLSAAEKYNARMRGIVEANIAAANAEHQKALATDEYNASLNEIANGNLTAAEAASATQIATEKYNDTLNTLSASSFSAADAQRVTAEATRTYQAEIDHQLASLGLISQPLSDYRDRLREIAESSLDAAGKTKATELATYEYNKALQESLGVDLTPLQTHAENLRKIEEQYGRTAEAAKFYAAEAARAYQAQLNVNQSVGLATDPFQALQMQLLNLNAEYARGGITSTQVVQGQIGAYSGLAGSVLDLTGQVTGAFSNLFKDNKALAIANAVIGTAEAIVKTIAQYGATPWGLASAAVAAAVGAAQIATIASTQPGGAKAPSVKGKAVSAPAAAGAASTTGGGRNRGPTQAVTIHIEGDVFGPEHFRKIVAGINGVQRDGTALLRIA